MGKYDGHIEKILKAACDTSGYTLKYIESIITDECAFFTNFNSINIRAWCFICSLLELDINSCSYGYNSSAHKINIGRAVSSGSYRLPITDKIFEITKLYKLAQDLEAHSPKYNYLIFR